MLKSLCAHQLLNVEFKAQVLHLCCFLSFFVIVGVSIKSKVANRVRQTLGGDWASEMLACSETWGEGVALVWIVNVNFYKLGFLGVGDHTVLLPVFPACPGLESLSP